MQQAILYQAYGGADFINECRYSLLKLLSVYNLLPPPQTGIIIYTDDAAAFDDLQSFFKTFICIPVTPAQVKQWRGNIDFVHRVKIEIIKDCLNRHDVDLLYCDTDTYVTQPVEALFELIKNEQNLMHQYEGVINRNIHPGFHKWEKFLSSTPIKYNGQTLVFSKQLQMFNAGVVGLQAKQKLILNDVLELTDAIYSRFPKHIAEQFAFSYCFQKSGNVQTADHVIQHYWNLKEFREWLQFFFLTNSEESVPNLVKKLKHVEAITIQQEKNAFENLPWWQRLSKRITGRGWKIARYKKWL